MATNRKTNKSAVEALRSRYIANNPEAAAAFEQERLNTEVAQLIHEYRKQAGLTQAQLARMVGTTQSAISRLEQASYEGHSLSMLDRIAHALRQHVRVHFAPRSEGTDSAGEHSTLRYAFQEVVRSLRRQRGLSVEEMAERLEIEKAEILSMERDATHRPRPLVLYKLSQFFGIPQERLAYLAGAVTNVPTEMREQASRFAAKSDSFSKLTREEQQTLDEFVKFLKSDT